MLSGLPTNIDERVSRRSLIQWWSAAQDDGVRNFIAFVAYAYPMQVAFLGSAEFAAALCLANIGTDGPAHAKEDRAAAVFRLCYDDRGITASRAGNSESALSHRLVRGLCTGERPTSIETALAGAQRGIIRAHHGASIGRYCGLEVLCSDIAPRASTDLLNVAPNSALNALASQIVEYRARCLRGKNFRGGGRLFA